MKKEWKKERKEEIIFDEGGIRLIQTIIFVVERNEFIIVSHIKIRFKQARTACYSHRDCVWHHSFATVTLCVCVPFSRLFYLFYLSVSVCFYFNIVNTVFCWNFFFFPFVCLFVLLCAQAHSQSERVSLVCDFTESSFPIASELSCRWVRK